MPTRFHLRCATRFLAPLEQVRDLTNPEGPWLPGLREALFDDWQHERHWEQATDAVRYEDRISFTPKAGKYLAIATERLLQRHHRHLAQQLPSDAQATAVSTLRQVFEVKQDHTTGFM
ncbi:MAG: hypothetical protein VX899_27015 [Myxococcota bacterium]|nr:hypothetical protein [Myxococcota bacterium]